MEGSVTQIHETDACTCLRQKGRNRRWEKKNVYVHFRDADGARFYMVMREKETEPRSGSFRVSDAQ